MFTRNGRRTGHVIAVQVKSGAKYRRADGYAIPVGDHAQDWGLSRIPVIGVVYDRGSKELFWVNLTKVLKEYGGTISWIPIPKENILSDSTLRGVIAEIEVFIDVEGMRVRRSSAAEIIESARRARHASIGANPRDVDDPNPLFEPLADFALKHEKVLRYITRRAHKYAFLMALGMIMAFEWPHQVRFVQAYSEADPLIWVGNIYLFTYILALVMFFEFKAKRMPRFTGYAFALIIGTFYINPFLARGGKDEVDIIWGNIWLWVGVIVPSLGYKLILLHYIREAIARRKRKARSAGAI